MEITDMELNERLRRLERRNVWLTVSLAVIFTLLIVQAVRTWSPPDTYAAKEFALKNSQGRTVAALTLNDSTEGPRLRFYDSNNNISLSLGVDETDEEGTLAWVKLLNNGLERASFQSSFERSTFSLDSDTGYSVMLNTTTHFGPYMALYGKDWHRRAILWLANDAPVLEFMGKGSYAQFGQRRFDDSIRPIRRMSLGIDTSENPFLSMFDKRTELLGRVSRERLRLTVQDENGTQKPRVILHE